MPKERQPPSRQTLNTLQAAQLEESTRKEESYRFDEYAPCLHHDHLRASTNLEELDRYCRMLDMRQGMPSKAAVRTGNTRVLVRMPSTAAVLADKPVAALNSKDTTRLHEEMSWCLWSSLNPGYKQQGPGNLRSMASTDYVWNEQEVRPWDRASSTEAAGCCNPTSACLQYPNYRKPLHEPTAHSLPYSSPGHVTEGDFGSV